MPLPSNNQIHALPGIGRSISFGWTPTAPLGILYNQLIDNIDTATFACSRYGAESIPYVILIDKDGTIFAHDFRDKVIEVAVKKKHRA